MKEAIHRFNNGLITIGAECWALSCARPRSPSALHVCYKLMPSQEPTGAPSPGLPARLHPHLASSRQTGAGREQAAARWPRGSPAPEEPGYFRYL